MTTTLRVCIHYRVGQSSCAGRGSEKILKELRRLIETSGSNWKVEESVCLGHCQKGPNVKGAPGGPILHQCQDAQSVLDRIEQEWER